MTTNTPVPLINVTQQNKPFKAEIMKTIEGLIDSSAFILGQEVIKFEEEFKSYTGVKHAISCASGTDALLLPLMALEIKPGDEVLVPSFTFYATAGSVARLGAVPIFVDSDDTYNMSTSDAARKISKKTKAIIPVHLFGQMANMPEFVKLAQSAKIGLIEDAAQSQGAALDGKQAGTWGDFGAFSFYPTKNLGAMGDAGMMSAASDEMADRLRMIRVHGSKVRYYHELVGVNSRLDNFQAAILRIKMRELKNYEKFRNELATHYLNCFKQLNLGEKVKMPVINTNSYHVWNQFTVRVQNRDKLRSYLSEKSIGSEIYYPLPMHMQKSFSYAGFREGDLPACELMAKEVVSLPMYPELTKAQVEVVVSAIGDFYKNS